MQILIQIYYPYLLITLIVLFFLALNFYAYKNSIKLPIYFELMLALALIIFAGLRSTDVDYMGYIDIFNKVDAAAHKSLLHQALQARDLLFGFMVIIKSSLNLNVTTFLLVSAALSIGIKFAVFRYAFGSAILGLGLYFFTYYFMHDFTQIRIAIALACCFLALVLLLKEHRVWYVFFCVVAVGFHAQTAFFVVATLPLLTQLKYKFFLILILIVISGLLFAGFDFLLNITSSRTSVHLGTTDLKLTAITALTVNAVLIITTYISIIHQLKQPFEQELAKASMLLYIGGFIFFFIMLNTSEVFAWRIYEMFSAFSIFIILTGLRAKPKKLTVIASITYIIFNTVIIIRSGLLVPYSIHSSFTEALHGFY
jgi:hypothetical protein